MDFMDGGDLFDHVIKKVYSEADGKRQLTFYGLKFAHAKNIAHRDLKPENILVHLPIAHFVRLPTGVLQSVLLLRENSKPILAPKTI